MDFRVVYANRGLDLVHPSPHGHALMGAVAARYVAKRLLEPLCSPHPPSSDARSVRRHHDGASKGSHGGESMHLATASNPLELEGEGNHTEVCYSSADTLPLATPLNSSWRLVDEGKAKGVPKLGLLSTLPGDSLQLSTWPGPPSCRILL